ncbi:Cytochrome c domain-containing protein [Pseudomonas chlororaphis]
MLLSIERLRRISGNIRHKDMQSDHVLQIVGLAIFGNRDGQRTISEIRLNVSPSINLIERVTPAIILRRERNHAETSSDSVDPHRYSRGKDLTLDLRDKIIGRASGAQNVYCCSCHS